MSILTSVPAWIWLVISTIFFAAGEFLSKKFALNPGWSIFGFIILVDIASITAWLPAIFQKNQLSITGVVWSILSLIMTAVIGILVFGERL
jgi:multidrug transporter EmrE-like cation transporter